MLNSTGEVSRPLSCAYLMQKKSMGKGKGGKIRGCTKGLILFSRPRWVDASTGELGPSSLASTQDASLQIPMAPRGFLWQSVLKSGQ